MANSSHVRASLRTDQGRVRSNNQDFVAWYEPADPEEEAQDGRLYILADGAGGMDAGEVASSYATERTLHHYLARWEVDDAEERLRQAMLAANDDLRALSSEQGNSNRMATTMVATLIRGAEATIANVGDSRAYLWRGGRIAQVTKDQSLVAKLVDEGAITAEEAANHPRKNVILYSLGSDREPRIDFFRLDLHAGDQLLLCSDGLIRHVDDEEIAAILGRQNPEEATQTLVDLANQRGGQDNISVGVLSFEPARPRVVTVPAAAPAEEGRNGHVWLWLYTLILSLVQSLLIFLIWILLRV